MPVAVQKYEPAAVVFPSVSISTRLLFFHSPPPPLPHALAQAVLRLSCRASGVFNSHLHPAAPPISSRVRGVSGLVCTGTAENKRAWCSMLRDLFSASGAAVSDADLRRVYLVCRQCCRSGRVRV